MFHPPHKHNQERGASVAIRNAAKGIILHHKKVLVNRCVDGQGNVYFDLPGGGQNQFETIEEALLREVSEETGYTVCVERFAALAEEICDNEEIRKRYYDYSHRVLHIFLARLADENRIAIKEMDYQQQESLWVPLNEADTLRFRPSQLSGKISELVYDMRPRYLGCSRFN